MIMVAGETSFKQTEVKGQRIRLQWNRL